MAKHLIVNVLGFMMILSLAACSSNPVQPPAKIVTETEYVVPPKPIVIQPDLLSLKDIEFIVVTPENFEKVMADLKNDKVLFALTSKGYEDIASNLSAVRAYIQQQRQVIILYEKVWDE